MAHSPHHKHKAKHNNEQQPATTTTNLTNATNTLLFTVSFTPIYLLLSPSQFFSTHINIMVRLVALAASIISISCHGFASAIGKQNRLRGGSSNNERYLNSVSFRMHLDIASNLSCDIIVHANQFSFVPYINNRTFSIIPSQAQASAPSKTNAPPHGLPNSTQTTPNAAPKDGLRPNVSLRLLQVPLLPIQLLQMIIQNIIIKYRPRGCVAL
jgi:hypothetical protein